MQPENTARDADPALGHSQGAPLSCLCIFVCSCSGAGLREHGALCWQGDPQRCRAGGDTGEAFPCSASEGRSLPATQRCKVRRVG